MAGFHHSVPRSGEPWSCQVTQESFLVTKAAARRSSILTQIPSLHIAYVRRATLSTAYNDCSLSSFAIKTIAPCLATPKVSRAGMLAENSRGEEKGGLEVVGSRYERGSSARGSNSMGDKVCALGSAEC